MTKYKQYFQEMLAQNEALFKDFKKLHDAYAEDPTTYETEFRTQGKEASLIIQRYINRLCLKMESGKYGKFSATLSDKFWEEVRKVFPKIDEASYV